MIKHTESHAANSASLQLSTEKLLELGADSRSMTDKNGLTSYGTSPGPRRAVPFGSCTASSPIECVFDAAVLQHELLREAQVHGDLSKQIRLSYHKIDMTLRHHLRIVKKDVRLALAPSGTDLEFLALALALGDRSRPLCNIVVGPQEIGSGSSMAAAGRYFDSILPHGPSQIKDTPVASSMSSLVHVETIPIRDAYGCIREQDDIDSETETIVRKAIAKRERVLIHIVAHSKTGVHAPSISKVRRLQRKYPRDISVVVDAAQARLSRQSMTAALEEGFWVLFTGSKFFGGPSFSGALLVPGSYDSVIQTFPPLPVEFSSYFSRWDFPKQWDGLYTKLSHDYNLGLLLRWFAALESIRAYYAVPGRTRVAIFKRFENMILTECSKRPRLKLNRVEPLQFPVGKERLLESKTTVFPFFVQMNTDSGKIRYFQNDELKKICKWTNEDISRFAVQETKMIRKVLSSKFHIGQPVSIGNVRYPAVLRIALGAALVTEVGLNHSYGSVLGERLDWLEEQVSNVFLKLDWISRNYILLDEKRENR